MPDCRFLSVLSSLVLAGGGVTGAGAGAGSWPRGDGNTFLSFGGSFSAYEHAAQPAAKFPAGHGLGGGAIFAGELRFSRRGGNGPDGYVSLSQRVATFAGGNPAAIGFSRFGPRDIDADAAFFVAPEIHLGHGFRTAMGSGWVLLGGRVHAPFSDDDRAVRIDGQIGTHISGDWMVMLGASRYAAPDGYSLTVTPSAAWQVGAGRTMQFSYIEEIGNEPASTLEASLWMEF